MTGRAISTGKLNLRLYFVKNRINQQRLSESGVVPSGYGWAHRLVGLLEKFNMTKLLSRAEVSKMLGVSTRTIDRLKARGLLPVTKVLSTVRFNPADVQAFLDSQRREGVRP
jgi:excisionase family DNA binding protein